MKSTGVVRKVDELGRIVIPKEVRKTLGINPGDPLEIFIKENSIIFQKYEPFCIFCGNSDEMFQYNGKNVCKACAQKLGILAQ